MAQEMLELRRRPSVSTSAAAAGSRLALTLRSEQGPLLWGLLGFLVGAVFWHLVGFWGFVSDVVFHGPASAAAAPIAVRDGEHREAPQQRVLQPRRRITPGVEPACVSIIRDARTGALSQSPCGRAAAPLSASASPGRQDRAVVDNGPDHDLAGQH